jgi:hypothetical protein
VYNYVTAAGEVGSGTPNAASGKHFSPVSPKGHKQENNAFVNGLKETGLSDKITLVQYKPRNGHGAADFQEQKLVDDIREKLSAGGSQNVAILHVVCGSKTGLVYPSMSTVQKLSAEFGDRLVVVIDACQLRCKLNAVADYTKAGYITLLTASKFYSGPPFR